MFFYCQNCWNIYLIERLYVNSNKTFLKPLKKTYWGKHKIHFADKRKETNGEESAFFSFSLFKIKLLVFLKLQHSRPRSFNLQKKNRNQTVNVVFLRPLTSRRLCNELKGLREKEKLCLLLQSLFLSWHHCMSPDWSVHVKIWRTSDSDIYNSSGWSPTCLYGDTRRCRRGFTFSQPEVFR